MFFFYMCVCLSCTGKLSSLFFAVDLNQDMEGYLMWLMTMLSCAMPHASFQKKELQLSKQAINIDYLTASKKGSLD